MDKGGQTFTVRYHFDGKAPIVQETYGRLMKVLSRFGPVTEEPKKTSIHLVHGSALAGVATHKDHLILTIRCDHMLTGPRVQRTERVSENRYHCEVKLDSPKDIDRKLIGWLREAYKLTE